MTDNAVDVASNEFAVGSGGVEHFFGVRQTGHVVGATKLPEGPQGSGKVLPRSVTWPAVEH